MADSISTPSEVTPLHFTIMSLVDAWLPSRETLQILGCSVPLLVGLSVFLKYRAAVNSIE